MRSARIAPCSCSAPPSEPPKSGNEHYPNLTVKKIPKQLLSRCEWGHDDYSLKVENLPKAPPPPPKADKHGQQSLFDMEANR
jgi:hypothetical protein